MAEHGGSEDKTYTYDADNRLVTATVSSGNNVTIESYTYDYEGNRISKQTNEDGRICYLNDDAYAYTQVSLELKKAQNGSYVIYKYYTRGTELLSADILEDGNYVKRLYITDGHGSVTALAENVEETGTGGNQGTTEESYLQELTDTYVYDAYGNLLKQTGDTDNDYLYTGGQYNETTGLYYLRARYLSPETGTFVSMDSYAGTLDNPVSLHKYLYANANPVMYIDPSGNFSLMETSIAQGIQTTINDLIAPVFTVKKVMTWANLIVTTYDIYQQMKPIFAGETNIVGLAWAIGRGMITQALLNCALSALLGDAATTVLKVVGIANDMQSFVEAVKSGDPKKILIESLRLAVSVYTLKCQCFTEDTLVSTVDGDRPIGELEAGDKVWAYNTKTGENEAKEITAVIVTETDVIVHVKTSDGEDIETTMFHPFYVRHSDKESDGSVYDGEWKAASNLLAGDVLQKIDGSTVYVTEVTVEKLPEIINVYNLEIEDLHTYYVADGVLVHNDGCASNDIDKKADEGGNETGIPHWDGSGPAPGVLGINENSTSNKAIKNYYPKEGGIEFVFDAQTNTFVVGKSNVGYGSPHQRLASSIGANQSASTTLGGTFYRGSLGEIFTTENSGHFGQNWTPELRNQFKSVMKSYGLEVHHNDWS